MTKGRWIASFDMGIKNFAFAIVSIDSNDFEIVHFENIDLVEDKRKDIQKIIYNMYDVLETFKCLWEQCEIFLIEQQMQYRHASNIKALKLSQHVLAYFMIHYKNKTIIEYPAYHKTQVFNAPPKLNKYERKKWSIQKVQSLLEQKQSPHLLHTLHKKDDVCDCILMCLSYGIK